MQQPRCQGDANFIPTGSADAEGGALMVSCRGQLEATCAREPAPWTSFHPLTAGLNGHYCGSKPRLCRLPPNDDSSCASCGELYRINYVPTQSTYPVPGGRQGTPWGSCEGKVFLFAPTCRGLTCDRCHSFVIVCSVLLGEGNSFLFTFSFERVLDFLTSCKDSTASLAPHCEHLPEPGQQRHHRSVN